MGITECCTDDNLYNCRVRNPLTVFDLGGVTQYTNYATRCSCDLGCHDRAPPFSCCPDAVQIGCAREWIHTIIVIIILTTTIILSAIWYYNSDTIAWPYFPQVLLTNYYNHVTVQVHIHARYMYSVLWPRSLESKDQCQWSRMAALFLACHAARSYYYCTSSLGRKCSGLIKGTCNQLHAVDTSNKWSQMS